MSLPSDSMSMLTQRQAQDSDRSVRSLLLWRRSIWCLQWRQETLTLHTGTTLLNHHWTRFQFPLFWTHFPIPKFFVQQLSLTVPELQFFLLPVKTAAVFTDGSFNQQPGEAGRYTFGSRINDGASTLQAERFAERQLSPMPYTSLNLTPAFSPIHSHLYMPYNNLVIKTRYISPHQFYSKFLI